MGLVNNILAKLRGSAQPAGTVSVDADAEGRVDECVDIPLARADGREPMQGILAVVDRMAETIADAVADLPPAEEVPEGWMMDSAGRLVRLANIKEADLLRDGVTRELALEGLLLHMLLKKFKARALTDMAEIVATSAAEYGVVMGGEKGNLSLSTYDGQWLVQRIYRDVISFSEQILAAKELIDRCITRWSEGADPNIATLIDRAFRASKKGDLRTGPVLELLRLRIEDPEWQEAMKALADSIDVTGSAVYVRISRRVTGDQYVPVSIDLATV